MPYHSFVHLFFFFFTRDVDGAIVRPLPRAKRMLSEATCLPHLVQVLCLLQGKNT